MGAKKMNSEFDHDVDETKMLNEAIKAIGEKLTHDSLTFGTTLAYIEDNYIIQENLSGRKKRKRRSGSSRFSAIGLKKGSILHARK